MLVICTRCGAANSELDAAGDRANCSTCGKPVERSSEPAASADVETRWAPPADPRVLPPNVTLIETPSPMGDAIDRGAVEVVRETGSPPKGGDYRSAGRSVARVTLRLAWSRGAVQPSRLDLVTLVLGFGGMLLLAIEALVYKTVPWGGGTCIVAGILLSWVVERVNATEITLDGDTLRSRHRPLPWPPERAWSVAQIERVHYAVQKSPSRSRLGHIARYWVLLRLRDGTWQPLMTNIQHESDAVLLRDALRTALGPDAPDRSGADPAQEPASEEGSETSELLG